jgi:transcriptional regulator with XRE-family HTH domain
VPTDQQREAFLAALREHANLPGRRGDIAEEAGVSKSMVSRWLGGDNDPDPDQVFAIERACKLPGGALSQHLGYVPVGASSVLPSIESDPALTPRDRKLVANLYLSLTSDVSS